MKTKTRLVQLLMITASFLPAGCGVSPQVDSTEVGLEDVLFTEDLDPGVAVLAFVENQLLVQPYPGADPQALNDLYVANGAVLIEELPEIEGYLLEVPPDDLELIATRLADSGLLETVQKNYLYEPTRTPNDSFYTRQSYLEQIGAPDAWDTTVGAEGVVIAIIDTGVDIDHPDLTDKIIDGWNAYDDNSRYADVQGHGTLVAGVAAAISNNRTGVTGVAWDCPLLVVRATDRQGRASAKHIAAGILWATRNGASVINVSFAPLWSNRLVRAAAQEAHARGSLVVISAGNSGSSTTARGYPEAVFVGAINSANTLASFSDRGRFVDVVAPGTAIRSTKDGGEYGMANGTSFSAPIVAGVAALVWSVNPELRPATVVATLLDNAVDLGATGKDTSYGNGAIDAAAAVEAATKTSRVKDTTPPYLKITRPASGDTFTGRFTATATATDRWGVADVVLSIDGIVHASDSRSAYRFTIDPASFAQGTHKLSFVATDLAGNSSTIKSINVRFRPGAGTTGSTGPLISFQAPADGATVAGDVTLRASVSDSDGLATVQWLIDGIPVHEASVTGRSTGVSYLWRTSDFDSGRHTITLVVTDLRGQRSQGQITLLKR